MKQFMTICEGLKRHLNYELQELTSVDLLNLFGRVITSLIFKSIRMEYY